MAEEPASESIAEILSSLEDRIAFTFKDKNLLEECLTHPSLAYETQREHFDNQRLEFLGDAVLQLILTHELYLKFDQFNEGTLTKMRSRLVSRVALTTYARRIALGEALFMGKGEEFSGGRERTSTLSDAFEALVGGIYLDGGYEAAKKFLLTVCAEDFAILHDEPTDINPKGHLQELLQAAANTSPNYTIVAEEGPDHLKTFVAKVEWGEKLLGQGKGRSKKEAETAAALAALNCELLKDLKIQTTAKGMGA